VAFVNVPKDLSKIKNKAFFNLTARQLICFSVAAVIGIPAYIFTRGWIGDTTAALLMIGLMLPLFFLAMYEKDGQPAELILRNFIRTRFYFPNQRPYKAENIYELLEMEAKSTANQTSTTAKAPASKHQASTSKSR